MRIIVNVTCEKGTSETWIGPASVAMKTGRRRSRELYVGEDLVVETWRSKEVLESAYAALSKVVAEPENHMGEVFAILEVHIRGAAHLGDRQEISWSLRVVRKDPALVHEPDFTGRHKEREEE